MQMLLARSGGSGPIFLQGHTIAGFGVFPGDATASAQVNLNSSGALTSTRAP